MNLNEFYSIPDRLCWAEEPYDENGIGTGLVSSHSEVRVQSQVVLIDKLKEFQTNNWQYAHNYNYFMSEETFEMLCEMKHIKLDKIIIPDDLYLDGFHIFIINPYFKPGEVLAVPQHDYEKHEPCLIG